MPSCARPRCCRQQLLPVVVRVSDSTLVSGLPRFDGSLLPIERLIKHPAGPFHSLFSCTHARQRASSALESTTTTTDSKAQPRSSGGMAL
jgi:hypothetical protein